MKINYLVSLLGLGIVLIGCNSEKKENTYKSLTTDFDEAKVYLYDGYGEQLVVENDHLDSTIVNPEGYKLTSEQLLQLDRLLSNQDTTGNYLCDWEASCFDPHHGVVFYKQQKIINHFSICFGCNQMKTESGQLGGCPRKLQSLFDSFKLKVDNQFYPASALELGTAIQQMNVKKYGVDYRERMFK